MSREPTRKYRLASWGEKQLEAADSQPSPAAVNDESVKTYQSYRRLLLEASAMIDALLDDFTTLDFDDRREDLFKVSLTDIVEKLEDVDAVRNSWFQDRGKLREGGGS